MTCETLTLGHNPFELPLSKFGVFLPSNRPQFLCERMISGGATVAEMEAPESPNSGDTDGENGGANEMKTAPGLTRQKSHFFSTSGAFSPNAQYDPDGEIDPLDRSEQGALDRSGTSLDLDRSGSSRFRRRRKSKNANGSKSSSALLGAFESVFEEATKNDQTTVIEQMVDALSPRVAKAKEAQAAQKNRELRAMFDAIDDDGSGELDKDEFAEAYVKVRADLTREQIDQLFDDADTDGNGTLDFDEFKVIASLSGAALLSKLSTANTGDVVGFANVEWSREKFFGEKLLSERPADLEGGDRAVAETQTLAMRLYESRVASLERAVAFFVLFHEMGARVAAFWPGVSRGLLGYRIDRTHSIMRIATTASPVSGADVRERMKALAQLKQWRNASGLILSLADRWQLQRKINKMFETSSSGMFGGDILGLGGRTDATVRAVVAERLSRDSRDTLGGDGAAATAPAGGGCVAIPIFSDGASRGRGPSEDQACSTGCGNGELLF